LHNLHTLRTIGISTRTWLARDSLLFCKYALITFKTKSLADIFL